MIDQYYRTNEIITDFSAENISVTEKGPSTPFGRVLDRLSDNFAKMLNALNKERLVVGASGEKVSMSAFIYYNIHGQKWNLLHNHLKMFTMDTDDGSLVLDAKEELLTHTLRHVENALYDLENRIRMVGVNHPENFVEPLAAIIDESKIQVHQLQALMKYASYEENMGLVQPASGFNI